MGCDDESSEDNSNQNNTPDAGEACPTPTSGPTIHSGEITADEVWTHDTGPHLITDNLSIQAKVTVEPCVRVEIAPAVRVNVEEKGALIAEADAERPILFTAQEASPWGHIHVSDPGVARFRHVTLENGGANGTTYSGATLVVTANDKRPLKTPVRVENVTVQGSVGLGVLMRGLSGFSEGSTGLTVAGSGASSEFSYPVRMAPEAASTLPEGTYTNNAVDAIDLFAVPQDVQANVTWPARGVPYRIDENIVITGGGHLQVAAGVTLSLGEGVSLIVEGLGAGELETQGTSALPVVVERADPKLAWGSLRVEQGSQMRLAHTKLRGGGADPVTWSGCSLVASGPNDLPLDPMLGVTDVTVSESAGYGVCLYGAAAFRPDAQGLEVTGAGAQSHEADFKGLRHPVLIGASALGTLPEGEYTGNARDAIHVDSHLGVVGEVTVRDVGVPYDIGGDGLLVVGSDELSGTLTLEPNVALLFEQGMSLDVDINGVLDAQGTSSAPVVFGSAAEIPSAGDWIGIYFWGPPVTESTLDNVRIEHAGADCSCVGFSCHSEVYDEFAAVLILDWLPSQAFITNSSFVSIAGHGVNRGWTSDKVPPDFTVTNTFTDVALCAQTLPKPETGQCPETLPCP